MPEWPPPGTWIAASLVHGREVRDDEPYPHIHGATFTGKATGQPVTLWRRNCAACTAERSRRAITQPEQTTSDTIER